MQVAQIGWRSHLGRNSLLIFCALCAACGGTAAAGADSSADGDNQFALDLYAQLSRELPGKNLFFSPASLSIGLAMTAAGARGQTQAEMAKMLHLDQDLGEAHARYQRLLEQWNASPKNGGRQLRVANRLWGQKDYPIRPEFLDVTRRQYGAEMLRLDFAQREAAAGEMNRWVEQQTESRIKNLIAPKMVDSLTRLVLTNAVYFKSQWLHRFNRERTLDEDFFVSAEKKVKTPLMHTRARLGYAEEETLQVLELPYAGEDQSMVVLLPKKTDGLVDLERSLTHERLASLLTRLRPQDVVTSLPRFKMETFSKMNPALQAMGMKLAFSRQADFSGISAKEDLYVSAVAHKAYVDVNEEGTEAAAATGVVIKARSAMPSEKAPEFRADHPFLFLIRDARSGNILFLGRLVDPSR